eukprot:365596-Chlamydomonas_euryale.AAC.2
MVECLFPCDVAGRPAYGRGIDTWPKVQNSDKLFSIYTQPAAAGLPVADGTSTKPLVSRHRTYSKLCFICRPNPILRPKLPGTCNLLNMQRPQSSLQR